MFDNPTKRILGQGKDIIDFASFDELFDAITAQKVSTVIVPDYAAQFWLLSEAGKSCCDSKGPINLPFSTASPHRLATRRVNVHLNALIENALYNLETSGSLGELRKRYFPLLTPTEE